MSKWEALDEATRNRLLDWTQHRENALHSLADVSDGLEAAGLLRGYVGDAEGMAARVLDIICDKYETERRLIAATAYKEET